MMPSPEAIILGLSGIVGFIASTSILTWFVGAQFSSNRNLMYTAIDDLSNKVLTKFETHEKQDAERFEALSNRIWDIQVSNALKAQVEKKEQHHRQ